MPIETNNATATENYSDGGEFDQEKGTDSRPHVDPNYADPWGDELDFGDLPEGAEPVREEAFDIELDFASQKWNRDNPDVNGVDGRALAAEQMPGFNSWAPDKQERAVAYATKRFLMSKIPGGEMSPVGKRIRAYIRARKSGDKKATKKALKAVHPHIEWQRELAEAIYDAAATQIPEAYSN